MVRIVSLSFILLSAPAYSDTYSCAAADGRTKLQSTPCKRRSAPQAKTTSLPVDKTKLKPVQPPVVGQDVGKLCHVDQRGWMLPNRQTPLPT